MSDQTATAEQQFEAAKAGTQTKKPRKPRAKVAPLAFYPGLEAKEVESKRGKDGKVTRPTKKLTEWPADFNADKHRPLTVDNFERGDVFYRGEAARLTKLADEWKPGATKTRRGGGGAKRLDALLLRISENREQLAALGVDLTAIDAKIAQLKAEKAAATSGSGATAG